MDWSVVALVVGVGFLVGLGLVGVLGRRESRALPGSVCEEIGTIRKRRANQHVVDLELRDGRRIHKVWIANGRYPAVIGGRTITQRYKVGDVARAHAR